MRWLLSLLVLCLISPASAVMINEVRPSGVEWVEIYNSANDVLNLSTWLIKDNSTDNPDSITCWTIPDCNLTTNANYFLILGRNTNITEITNSSVTYYYTDDSAIGNGLTDKGDNITFYSSSFATSFVYNSSISGKSWQRVPDGSDSITSCDPTPGSANSCSGQLPPEEDQYDLKLEIKIQNATENIQAKDLFKLTNLNPKTGQYVNATVKFNATINNNLEYESAFTVDFVQWKSTDTGTWTPQSTGTYMLCGEITSSSFADPDATNNKACTNIIVAENPNQNTTGNETTDENETAPLLVSIMELPTEAKQGENFTAKIKVTNNFNETKTADIYSYAYSGSTLATAGGWTGNMQTLNLTAGESKVVNLINNIKPDAIVGAYSFKVRAVVDSKKYDKTSTMDVIVNPNPSNLSVSENSKSQASNETSKSQSAEGNSTGSFVWFSGSTSINVAYWLFTAVLLIFVIVLLLTLLRKQNP